MILYDSNFKLLGISQSTLLLLGYSGFGSFLSRHSDISELFLSENGFFVQTDEHFIETIIKNQKAITTLIKTADNKAVEAIIHVDIFFQADIYENQYLVTLEVKNHQNLTKNKSVNSVAPYQKRESKLSTLPNIFEKEYKNSLEDIKNQKMKNMASGSQLNKEWLAYSAKKLDLDVELFNDLLVNLLVQANEQEEMLYESLLVGDKTQSSLILTTLRDSASTLNIRPLTRAIYNLENSDNNDISDKFREYKDIIMQINKITTKRD
ncbi:hypothetical protein [Campylobacter geochelonis]|uniref:Uncharacterized protein n=1 Tax=Campylobacter geochelonis TaxID=1780362 RepID=A0A128EH92_9BACT|nr:hypothetical protein [Campylobacter geochelonis]QKF70889.1 hypothetical protein CGEO_0566 [Campylobacter geochelonis]CZE47951.1 Uncharacterised protein [Campylobacter geochelonis]CZE48896.1 Uncharacterised protein [Campylobacter geochelonis]CZE51383.1 Uncharacterised protein [Campylobacter geochelonis]